MDQTVPAGVAPPLHFGPRVVGAGQVEFGIWAPSVPSMSLVVDGAPSRPMQPQDGGWFSVTTSADPGAAYQFELPDGMRVPDPAARAQRDDVHGESLLVDQTSYQWRHTSWRNRPWHEAVIYELHPGAFGGFAGVARHLDRLVALGITAIELMPIADFPGRHNWGYDGVLPYAPDHAYGSPDDLKALVDAAHGKGLMVLLDVVYNHFGPDGAYLHAYAKEFFDEGVHTPWGAAIDFKRPEVCAFFIQNALMWVNEFRFDGLRFDAVHAISPAEFLPRLARAIRDGADHDVHLVLEHEGNKSSLLRGPDTGLFDAQWADDWHHCLHVLLTGEREGYYESFQQPARQLARAMQEGFVFQGEVSPHHGTPRGEPSGNLPPTAFVVCLQNHDQIGNRAMGERLSVLTDPQALAAATVLLLLSPSIPLLFMGDEWGTHTPFLFFTDHNEDLAKLVREGRRREFAHFAAFQDEARRALIPDPNAASTFTASVPDFEASGAVENQAVATLYRQLLTIRRDHVLAGIPGCKSLGAEAIGETAVHGRWALGSGKTLTLAANFGEADVVLPAMDGEQIFSTRPQQPGKLASRSAVAMLADTQ